MKASIYIVEEKWIAEMCKCILEACCPSNFEVRLFSEPSAALAALRNETVKPQLVCASLRRMDGLSLAREVKALEPETRFLLLSGYPPAVLAEQLSASLVRPDAVLLKPFEASEFTTLVTLLCQANPLPLGDSASRVWPFSPLTLRDQLPVRPGARDNEGHLVQSHRESCAG